MNKIFTDDLNKVPVPNENIQSFELAKMFLDYHNISVPIKYVAFDDSNFDVIIGFDFNTNHPNDPTFEFCFSCGKTLLMYFREAK